MSNNSVPTCGSLGPASPDRTAPDDWQYGMLRAFAPVTLDHGVLAGSETNALTADAHDRTPDKGN